MPIAIPFVDDASVRLALGLFPAPPHKTAFYDLRLYLEFVCFNSYLIPYFVCMVYSGAKRGPIAWKLYFIATIVQIYVGIIFNALPYLSIVLILMRVHKEIYNIPLLIWNIICVVIMFLSLIGIYFGFFISPKKMVEKIIG